MVAITWVVDNFKRFPMNVQSFGLHVCVLRVCGRSGWCHRGTQEKFWVEIIRDLSVVHYLSQFLPLVHLASHGHGMHSHWQSSQLHPKVLDSLRICVVLITRKLWISEGYLGTPVKDHDMTVGNKILGLQQRGTHPLNSFLSLILSARSAFGLGLRWMLSTGQVLGSG